jgi:agmatinase
MLPDIMLPYGGVATFLRAKLGSLDELSPGKIGLLGIPYDATVPGRAGTKHGPKAVREASVNFVYYMETSTDKKMINLNTKRVVDLPAEIPIIDLGDVPISNNMELLWPTITAKVEAIATSGAIPVIIGGEHSITAPCFEGFANAVRKHKPSAKVGYIQFDGHLDLMDQHPLFGKYSSGSPARRVSELPSVDPRNMVILGVGGYARLEQYEYAKRQGITIFTEDDVQSMGIDEIARKAGEIASKDCESIYLTVDIDVVSAGFAPGTGQPNLGGISAGELLRAMDVLSNFPIGALDVVEVSPVSDPSGVTAKLASITVINWIAANTWLKS